MKRLILFLLILILSGCSNLGGQISIPQPLRHNVSKGLTYTPTGTVGFLISQNGDTTTSTNAALEVASFAINSITGSTQCLQVSSAGVVSGTGSACGAGAGGGGQSLFATTTDRLGNALGSTFLTHTSTPWRLYSDGLYVRGNATVTDKFTSGEFNIASGDYSAAFGSDTRASGNSSVSFGENTIASGRASFAAGNNSTASGDYSVSLGSGNIASGLYTFVSGNANTATLDEAVAFGFSNDVQGHYAGALGGNNNVLLDFAGLAPDSSYAIGSGNFIDCPSCYVMGINSEAHDFAESGGAIAIGNRAVASSTNAITIGSGINSANRLINTTANSLFVGFNSTLPSFIVGKGNGAGTFGKIGIGISTFVDGFGLNVATTTQMLNTKIVGQATSTVSLWVGSAGTASFIDMTGGDLFVQDDLQVADSFFANGVSTTTATTTIAGESGGGGVKIYTIDGTTTLEFL